MNVATDRQGVTVVEDFPRILRELKTFDNIEIILRTVETVKVHVSVT